MPTAAEHAAGTVASVRQNPAERLALMRSLYEAEPGRPELHLPYRRAALAFMGWQLRRGLLGAPEGEMPGSPWWRAVNERLLRDTAEARAHVLGLGGPVSSWSAGCCIEFAEQPSAGSWYRAHNATIVAAYLDHRELAESESHAERFFLNLILARVLFAHALVAAPRLALSWLRPVGPVLGEPRLTITGIFVSLSRVMPDRYPLTKDLRWYIDNEHSFGRILDLGLIQPRLESLYSWSAAELATPELSSLVRDGVPTYAWDVTGAEPWNPPAGRLARAARSVFPARRPDAVAAVACRATRDELSARGWALAAHFASWWLITSLTPTHRQALGVRTSMWRPSIHWQRHLPPPPGWRATTEDEGAGIARGQSRDSAVEGIGQALRRQGLTIGSAQWFIMQGKGVDYGDPNGLYTQPGGRIGKRVDDAIAMLTGKPVRSGSTTVTLPEPPDFLAVYSSDIDGDGHAYGPNAPEMLETLRETDAEIGRLIRTVKDVDLWGRTTWILTADHGMSEWRIPQGPAVVHALADAGFTCEVLGSGQRPTNPTTQVVIVTGGSCSVHLLGDLKHDSAAVARVRHALLTIEGVKAVHDKEQQQALRMAPQYGELIVEVNEPYSLFMTPPREGADGLHGGRAEMAVPLILSGHRVRPGALPRDPRHVDVAPTIAHLLGAGPPAASEGRVLSEVLLDA